MAEMMAEEEMDRAALLMMTVETRYEHVVRIAVRWNRRSEDGMVAVLFCGSL